MLKSIKYRLCPTSEQSKRLDREMDICRLVYNLALETKITAYKSAGISLSAFDLHKQLTELRASFDWIRVASRDAMERSIINMETAFNKFFKGAGYPNFKKKSARQSFTVREFTKVKNGKIFFTSFRDGVSIVLHRPILHPIRQATISRANGRYFVSCLVDTLEPIPSKQPVKENTSVGVDLGINSFAITSEGQKIENPKHYRQMLSKLKYLQRVRSKSKGKRISKRITGVHFKIANKRADFLHKLSSQLINNHDTICIENLNVAGMVKNRRLALSISDAGWGEFVRQLKYKAEWYGKNLLVIDRFAPSSKTCSCCGAVNANLKISDREWACNACGAVLDRDVNAATNIKNFALKSLCTERIHKNQEELPALMGSQDT